MNRITFTAALIKKIVNEIDHILLTDTEQIKWSDKVLIQCKVGHEPYTIKVGSLIHTYKNNGEIRGCRLCYCDAKFKLAKDAAKELGGKLLSSKYERSNKPLKWKCNKCGHIWNAVAYDVIVLKHWCRACRRKREDSEYNTSYIGETFGNLTVVALDVKRTRGTSKYFLCRCRCGNYPISLRANDLRSKSDNSRCKKCIKFDRRKYSKNESVSTSLTWKKWYRMTWDVSKESEVGMVKRWKKYENFLEDMGECPEGHSIFRLDENKPYSKKNCVWTPSGKKIKLVRERKHIIGKRVGHLTYIKSLGRIGMIGKNNKRMRMYLAVCDCNRTIKVTRATIRTTTSCGHCKYAIKDRIQMEREHILKYNTLPVSLSTKKYGRRRKK